MARRRKGRTANSAQAPATVRAAPTVLARHIESEVSELEAIATSLELMTQAVVRLDAKSTAAVYFLAVQASARIDTLTKVIEEATRDG